MFRSLASVGLLLGAALAVSLAQNPGSPGTGKESPGAKPAVAPKSQAVIVVQVPADAEVWIGSQKTTQRGTQRTFRSQPLEPGKYQYKITVKWKKDGKDMEATRTVDFEPGRTVNVDLTREAGSSAAKTETKKAEPPTVAPKKVETKTEQPKKLETKKVEEKKVETKPAEPAKKVEPIEVKKEPAAAPAKKDDKSGTSKDEKKSDSKSSEPKKDGAGAGPARERSFEFTYAGRVTKLEPGKTARVWLPLPPSTPEQQVRVLDVKVPGMKQEGQDREYGNQVLFFEAKSDSQGEVPFEMRFQVARREVRTDASANLTIRPKEPESLVQRFLQPDSKVPVEGKPLELIKDRPLPKDQFQAAKVLYDVVNGHMTYDKSKPGWGQGDAVWACDSKFGNCSDFHSLFISLARGTKIPSKFEMGFPIPEDKKSGTVGGYHCWAWFLPQGKGWVPVDISEANRFPDRKEYYFGNLSESRVQFSTGRDITLEPRQSGAPLNFFIYPYAEVDGRPQPQEAIQKSFSFRDL